MQALVEPRQEVDGTRIPELKTIVADALPSLESVDVSMYEALEAAGHRPVRALQRLSALLLTGEQAKLLQAKEGDAGLAVERLGFLRDGRAVAEAYPL